MLCVVTVRKPYIVYNLDLIYSSSDWMSVTVHLTNPLISLSAHYYMHSVFEALWIKDKPPSVIYSLAQSHEAMGDMLQGLLFSARFMDCQ